MKNFIKKPLWARAEAKRHKICFALPAGGNILRVETHLSIIGLMFKTPHDFYSAYRTGCYIQDNRYNLAQTAIREGCDKLFFLDADMIVDSDAINKLLALNKPFVGAAYNMRGLPTATNVKTVNEEGKVVSWDLDKMPKEPFKTHAVPTGCMLIDIPTLLQIPQPWFQVTHKEDGSLDRGEDVWFSEQAQRAGFEVWCDPTIGIGHIGTYVY